MFKAILVLVTMVMMSNANATVPNDKWVAEGVRMVKFQFLNNTISVTPVSPGVLFDTEQLCKDFILTQQSMALGTFEGQSIYTSVVAKCSKVQ